MKLYKFTCGVDEKVGLFADEVEAYDRRTEVDPTFHFLPCVIEEIAISGYKIVPIDDVPVKDKPPEGAKVPLDDEFTGMEVPGLKEWLNANGVKYTKQWGAEKLREAARTWVASQPPKESVEE